MSEKKTLMQIRFYLRTGNVLTMRCTEFTVTRDGSGAFVGYSYDGAVPPRPLYIDCSQIVAIELIEDWEEGEANGADAEPV